MEYLFILKFPQYFLVYFEDLWSRKLEIELNLQNNGVDLMNLLVLFHGQCHNILLC